MSTMTDRIAAHLNAWKDFQCAPHGKSALDAEARMLDAMDLLLGTQAESIDDIRAFYRHLDWYAKEERDQAEPQIVAALSNVRMLASSLPDFRREVFG